MAIPRSTLVTGAIALFSTSALVYVLLKPPAPPPLNPLKYPVAKDADEPPYTLAQPGALNPIAAKVLAEGGPRTPTVGEASNGPRRGVARFRLALDTAENLDACLQQVWAKAVLLEGDATEVLTCQGTGARSLEGQLSLSAMPHGGSFREAPESATCGVRWSGSLSGADGVKLSLSSELSPTVGALEGACQWRQEEALAAMKGEVEKRL